MDIKSWLSRYPHAATSVLHTGRYCEEWKASTHHTGKPSFHLVFEGRCWLHVEGSAQAIQLREGDIIFFFSGLPFYLMSSPDTPPVQLPEKTMSPLNAPVENDTALLCGFIHPGSRESQLLFALMPEYLLIGYDSGANKKLRYLFELVRMECLSYEESNALAVTRLTDLMLVWVVEQLMDTHQVDVRLLQGAQNKPLTELFIRILQSPAEEWSVEYMAGQLDMSRSTLIRKVQAVTGYSPSELITRLRINVAVKLLRRGYATDDVSIQVGYTSSAGFYRAFRKVTGVTPAYYRSP